MEHSASAGVKGMYKADDLGAPVLWETKYVSDRATVMVNGSGRLSLTDMMEIAKGTTRLLEENSASRVILDCSDADLDMGLVDIFYLPESYSKLGMPRNARIALILPKGPRPSDIYEFLETVYRNNGYTCRLFDSQQSAEQWLQ